MLEEQEEKKLIKLIIGILKLDVNVLSNLDDYVDIINNDELIYIIDLFNISEKKLQEIVIILEEYKSERTEEKKLKEQEEILEIVRKLEEKFQNLLHEIPLEKNVLTEEVEYLLECMTNENKEKNNIINDLNKEINYYTIIKKSHQNKKVYLESLKENLDKRKELWGYTDIILKILDGIKTDSKVIVLSKEQLIKDIINKICQKLDFPLEHQMSNKRSNEEDHLYEPLSKLEKTDFQISDQSTFPEKPGPSVLQS